MRQNTAAEILKVAPDSLAAELGLNPGDRIIRINRIELTDLIDYQLAECGEKLFLEVEKNDGQHWEIELEKSEEQGLGLTFTSAIFDGIKSCKNHCLFCFIDQMPPGQRSSLYIKDDDYRLSFLQGSYVTLTNFVEDDWERIHRLRLSPLYISVHATDSEVRKLMLGTEQGGNILAQLKKLSSWGCQLHAQAVLCPGINDGKILEKTITDLGELWPNLKTVAIVPLGLTSHRLRLPRLRKFYPSEAADVIRIVHHAQDKFLSIYGSRLVYASDEFYLQAGKGFPDLEEYEELMQLENGVGLWPLFKAQFEQALTNFISNYDHRPRSFTVVTGVDAGQLWLELQATLKKYAPQIKLGVLPVTNRFFGPEVTVSGLVTGGDILLALRHKRLEMDGSCLLLPRVMLCYEEKVFLDGMTLENFCAATHLSVKVLNVNGEEVVKTLLGLEGC